MNLLSVCVFILLFGGWLYSPALALCFQIRADGRTDPDTFLPLLLARLHFLDREGVRGGVEAEKSAEGAGSDTSDAGGTGGGGWTVSGGCNLLVRIRVIES